MYSRRKRGGVSMVHHISAARVCGQHIYKRGVGMTLHVYVHRGLGPSYGSWASPYKYVYRVGMDQPTYLSCRPARAVDASHPRAA